MLKLVSVALVCVVFSPSLVTASSDGWVDRAGAGFVGEVASVVLVGVGMFALGEATHVRWNEMEALGPAMLGLLILIPGIPAATAGGVCVAGSIQGQDGRCWAAFLGGLAGLPVGVGLVALGGVTLSQTVFVGVPLFIAGALAPTVGATIGYDLSRSRGWEPDSRLGRFVPPSIFFANDVATAGKRSTRIDAKLLTVRF